jgi:hypothetical protein
VQVNIPTDDAEPHLPLYAHLVDRMEATYRCLTGRAVRSG